MASYVVAGLTFNDNDLVTEGVITEGASNTLLFGSGLQLTDLLDRTVGFLVSGDVGSSIALGDATNRAGLQLTWNAGEGLSNQPGDDFAIFENGFADRPEGYAVAVRNAATGDFTPFRYEFSDGFDNPAINTPDDDTGVFATGFDLSSFGLTTGQFIDAIRIVNLLATDTVDGADGQGRVDFTGSSGFVPLNGAGGTPFNTEQLDPDITLVAALGALGLVPQPVQLFDASNNLVGGFDTIQSAVDAASDGYRVVVAAGTYSENVVLDKSLTLIGANFGLAGDDPARGAESIIEGSFTLGDDAIAILGFEFANDSGAILGGGNGSVNYSNITIQFNDFVELNNDRQSFIINGFGRGGAPTGGADWLISQNRFDGITGNDASILRMDNVNGLTITDNVGLHDDAGATGRRGFQIDNSQNVRVSGNTVDLGITDFSNPFAVFQAARYTLQLSLDDDGSAQSTANVEISNNAFSGAFDGIITLDDRDLTGVDITGNTFTDLVFGVRLAAAFGDATQGTHSDIEISGNSFNDIAASAVLLDHSEPTEAIVDIVIEDNTFNDLFPGITHLSGETRVMAGTNILEGSDADEELLGGTETDTIAGFGGNDIIEGGLGTNTLTGGLGNDLFRITAGEQATITDFGGLGRGARPGADIVSAADTIQFTDPGQTPEVMQLTQAGSDLVITFLGDPSNTRVVLQDFELENIDNLLIATNGSVNFDNIVFVGSVLEDSFDVFNADSTQSFLFNENSVTFLNDLDNTLDGLAASDDVINSQGGDDTIAGLSGNDILRGGPGDDILMGGSGDDELWGDAGDDELTGGPGSDTFVFRATDGTDTILDFEPGTDLIGLAAGLTLAQLDRVGDQLLFSGDVLAVLPGVDTASLGAATFVEV